MSGHFRPLLVLCAAALFPAVVSAAKKTAAPQPPLPEPELPLPSKPFELVPKRQVEGEQPVEPEIDPQIAPLPRIVDDGTGETYDRATDPIRDSPVEPAPDIPNMEQLQEIDAPGAPSDGEPMPEIPPVPGLVVPKFRPGPRPGTTPPESPALGPVPGQETSPGLLPAPDLEFAAKARWFTSPYQAFTAASQEQKPILVFFAQLLNGAGPSASLNDDLFVPKEFNEFASARLVLTKLPYPTGSPGKNYSEEKLAVLNMLKQKYKIRGFPVVILLDDKGREIERISGYSRVRDQNGVLYSSAATILDRLKEAEKRFSERKRYRQDRFDRLVAQGYRTWYSTVGTSLLGKLVRADQQQVILMDENNEWRAVRNEHLKLYDAEWARRKQAGLIPDADSTTETAGLDGLPKP